MNHFQPPMKYEELFRRSLILTALYALPARISMDSLATMDPDIWWHLRTGQWIFEHGAVPSTDSFSSYGIGKPFVAYSWLFEVLVYGLYSVFGLVGLVIYCVVLTLAITVALHKLIWRLEPRVANSSAITGLGLTAIGFLFLTPRPWLFTILFFVIELDIIWRARQSGNYRRLLLLPPLFALWANIHIQFIYGLLVLGIATAEPLIDRLLRHLLAGRETKAIPTGRIGLIMVACLIATLVNPYHFRLYDAVIDVIRYTGFFKIISEMQALRFRSLSDWATLIATLSAAFALGWRRDVRPFPILLLLAGAFLSFRAQRDAWFVAIVATAIIAESLPVATAGARDVLTRGQMLIAALAIGITLFFTARFRNVSEEALTNTLVKKYPVAAAAIVEQRSYPGPLYNDFNWGGYLIWRLPHLPVALDGRGNVHGDKRVEKSLAAWNGTRNWASDPELAAARLVIAQVDEPLSSLLRFDPRFELVYEDAVATVFIAAADHKASNR